MSKFIPKPYKKEPITIRMSSDKIEQIDRLSAEFNLSRSAFIYECIDYAMEHMSPINPEGSKGPIL